MHWQPVTRLASAIAAVIAALAQVGCGGGGGGGGGSGFDDLTFFDAIAAGPLDGDGLADLVIGNTLADARPQRGRLTVLLQSAQSPGQFTSRTDFALGNDADCYGVAIGDVDGDGRADVVATSTVGRLAGTTPDGKVHVFLQDAGGNGKLQPAQVVATRPRAHEVAIADVNGDGRPDLVVGHSTGVDVILQSATPGRFGSPVTVAVAGGVVTLGAADLDSDGRVDIVAGNGSGVHVLLQAAGGSFAAATTYASGYDVAAVAVANLDADAYPDVVAVDATRASSSTNLVVLRGQPGAPGTLGNPAEYVAGDYPTDVAIADLDRDGAPDVAVAEGIVGPRNPRLVVLRQRGAHDGALQAAESFASGQGVFYELAVADLDGDGLLDVAGAGDAAYYLPQRAGATFAFDLARRLFSH